MQQLDMFEDPIQKLTDEVKELKRSLDSIRRGAFAQISGLREELTCLAAHCEVMSDELFQKESAS